MTWTIEKDKLIEALDTLSLVPSQPGLPSSEYIRISKNGNPEETSWMVASTATGTVQLNGTGKWPWKKDFFLDRRLFVPFVAASKEMKVKNDFEFFANGKKQLVVQHGRRKVRFDVQPKVPGYGFPPKAKLVAELELTDHVRGLVHCARECASGDVVTPQLNCVYLQPNGKNVHIYATNRKIVYFGHSRAKLKNNHAIPIPLFLVTLLGQAGLRAIHYKDKFMSLVFSTGEIWQPTSLRATKGFPASKIYKQMAKVESYDLVFLAECKKFSKVLARLSQYLASVRRQDWVLKLKGEKGSRKIFLTCSVPTGKFHEIAMASSSHKKSFEMEWPLDMLLPVFEYIQKDKGEMKVYHHKQATYVLTSDVKMAIPERES